MKKMVLAVLGLCTCLTGLQFASSVSTKAADTKSVPLTNLESGVEYSYDLDGDGQDETLSYTMDDAGNYILSVNGENLLSLPLGEWYYGASLQIADLDGGDDALDLFAYAYCCSDDIGYSALYRYENGSLNCLYSGDEDGMYGYIEEVSGNGLFSLCVDRCVNLDCLIGNHWDLIEYEVANGLVSRVATDVIEIDKILTPEGVKKGSLTPVSALSLYTEADASSETFTIPENDLLTPVVIKMAGNDTYVGFEAADGQIGYLNIADFGYDHPAFTDICLAD